MRLLFRAPSVSVDTSIGGGVLRKYLGISSEVSTPCLELFHDLGTELFRPHGSIWVDVIGDSGGDDTSGFRVNPSACQDFLGHPRTTRGDHTGNGLGRSRSLRWFCGSLLWEQVTYLLHRIGFGLRHRELIVFEDILDNVGVGDGVHPTGLLVAVHLEDAHAHVWITFRRTPHLHGATIWRKCIAILLAGVRVHERGSGREVTSVLLEDGQALAVQGDAGLPQRKLGAAHLEELVAVHCFVELENHDTVHHLQGAGEAFHGSTLADEVTDHLGGCRWCGRCSGVSRNDVTRVKGFGLCVGGKGSLGAFGGGFGLCQLLGAALHRLGSTRIDLALYHGGGSWASAVT